MKKALSVLFALMIVLSALTLSVSAKIVPFEKDYVSDGDFVLASFHNVKPFIAGKKNAGSLDDAVVWLADTADEYNITYVSFIGNMSTTANYVYADVVTKQGLTQADLLSMNEGDVEWQKDFNLLRKTASQLTDVDVPYGVSIGLYDYYGDGFARGNHITNCFQLADFVGTANVEQIAYDANNFAILKTEGTSRYIIYQLEAFPRKKTIDWFNGVQAQYPDARAIIYTTSFAQADGEMYTQHDWSLDKSVWYPTIFKQTSTKIKTNMVWADSPHDGDQLWKDAFAGWDNILCIVSANASTGKEIVTKTFKNNNGYEVLSVVADLESGYAKEDRAFPVLIKISEDNKTLDIRYAAPFEGYDDNSKIVVNLNNIADLPDPDPMIFLPKIPGRSNSDSTAYINGYAGNLFKPNGNMTKAEACTIFARLLLGTQNIPDGYTTRFTDVKTSDWFYNAVAYLDETGFLFSTETDTYNPNKPITRAEFVELAYLTSNLAATESITFNDVDESNKYYKAIVAAAASGLVNGYEDNTFRPDNTITRAEVVTVINRLLSLYAGNDAISRDHLTTIFSDIKGHWAETQILLASNSNINSPQYYAADRTALKKSASEISFQNDYVKISISKKNAKVTEIINLMTGEDILAVHLAPVFASLTTKAGAALNPASADVVDGRLVLSFKGIGNIYLLVEPKGDYIAFTLDCNLPATVGSFSFGTLLAEYNWELDNENAFGLSGVAMTTTVDPTYYPGGSLKATKGTVYTAIGVPTFGSKFAIAFSRMTEHRDHLKSIVDDIDPNKGITSKHGGPYALDNADLFGDYVIVQNGLFPETALETAQVANRYSIDHLDMHQGNRTFIQGDFNFVCARTEQEKEDDVFIPASVFKERIADVVRANGVKLALHTYSSLVATPSKNILTNPELRDQLFFAEETYTVRGRLSQFRTNIKTYEDASKFQINPENANVPYRGNPYCKYILIDDEIILVQQGTSSGFLNVKRGQLGTKPVAHSDGAVIRQFLGWYSMFQPKPLSDLFYKVAEDTAKAYNEGGYEMIYLDGLESFSRDYFTEKDARYYYYAEFVRTVVSNCDVDPLIEMSSFLPCIWSARGRGGAVDHARRGYKEFKNSHLAKQVKYHDYFYTATVGWFHYAPDMDAKYKNALIETLFRDDLDHMGSLALANDFGTVLQPFSVANFSNDTMLEDNFDYYGIYTRLREGGYFAPEVKKAILNGEYEYKVFQQDDGTWAFKEMNYVEHKTFMLESDFTTGKAENPFNAQTPYVRIEQRYSSLGENSIVVKEFDETQPVSKAVGSHTIPETDYIDNYAFMIKVFGNGTSDKIQIQLTSYDGSHIYDIPLNFKGWKDIVLVEADDSGRAYCELRGVTTVKISLVGSCSGVKIDDLTSVKIVEAPVSNPSVTINGKTMTFNTELKSGEYVEFYPETGKAYQTYYIYEYKEDGSYKNDTVFVKEITYTGSVEVPAGSYSYTYNAQPLTDAPTRATVVIGTSGAIIENPDDWNAPQIEIPAECMEFKFD